MDIIVRIPKSQVAHFWGDKTTSPVAFWRFAKKPKNLKEGDFIWFTRPEGVVAGAKVTEIVAGDDMGMVLDTVDPIANYNATWNGEKTISFKRPVASVQFAQQGYRYATESERKLLRAKAKGVAKGNT